MKTSFQLSFYLLIVFTLICNSCSRQMGQQNAVPGENISNNSLARRTKGALLTGADQTGQYLSYLKGKRIGMVINPTSVYL